MELAYVDQGYTGEKAAKEAEAHAMRLELVRHEEAKRGFVLLPRRWVVERDFAWASRFRRLAKDYERLPATLWRGCTSSSSLASFSSKRSVFSPRVHITLLDGDLAALAAVHAGHITRRHRMTKVPYTPGTLLRAFSTDLMTWKTFSEAFAACEADITPYFHRTLGHADTAPHCRPGFTLLAGDPGPALRGVSYVRVGGFQDRAT